MNSQQQIYLAALLAIGNGVLSLACLVSELKRPNSLFTFFWLTSLYFVGIPLLSDTLAFLFGVGTLWSLLLRSVDINFLYQIDSVNLLRVSLFVAMFNSLVWLTPMLIAKVYFIPDRMLRIREVSHNDETRLIAFFCALGFFGLLIFLARFGASVSLEHASTLSPSGESGVGFIAGIYSACISLSGVAVYYSVKHRNYIWAITSMLPALMMAYLTAQRPHVIPVLICGLAGYLVSMKRMPEWRILISTAIAGLAIAFILVSIRKGFSEAQALFIHQLPYPINRDCSSDTLYYCFSDQGLYTDVGMKGANTKRLMLTGLYSNTLVGSSMQVQDITAYIGYRRFHWTSGTLHPTLYGWAFVDMKWMGIWLAVFIASVLSVLERLAANKPVLPIIVLAASSIFIVVAMRGSVQFGYSKMIYALLLGGVAYFMASRFLLTPLLTRSSPAAMCLPTVTFTRQDDESGVC